jgi:hypothetical protein
MSTLRFFRKEYEDHIRHRRCPAQHCAIGAAQGGRA